MKIDIKRRNQLLSLIGGVVGAIVGYFYPALVQGYLPIIGIGVGLFISLVLTLSIKTQIKRKLQTLTIILGM